MWLCNYIIPIDTFDQSQHNHHIYISVHVHDFLHIIFYSGMRTLSCNFQTHSSYLIMHMHICTYMLCCDYPLQLQIKHAHKSTLEFPQACTCAL